MEATPGTMSERGEKFVAAWPAAITRRLDLGPEWMATAMVRAGLISPEEEYDLRARFRKKEAADQVASLTLDQAQSVIGQLRAISRDLADQAKTRCHYCGQELQGGTCPGGCE